jgi:hypothetical protein|tara:strand:+ start:64060 stop:64569 length:510 start_codon:yes stop_codon:yes gene_type:complete
VLNPTLTGEIKVGFILNYALLPRRAFYIMNIDKQKANGAVNRGTLYSFIPKPLEIEGKPELNVFPLNVLFSSFTNRGGVRVMGSACYDPDFKTFKQNGVESSMEYRNKYGGTAWLKITYNSESNGKYRGEKYINDKSVVMANGPNWKVFFIHFTMIGLIDGELCEFKEV